MIEDTIVALATPPGEGAIGIVRLSGPAALAIARGFWHGAKVIPRRVQVGTVREPSGEIVDEVILIYMPGPHSFTGEDVVELHGHGSPLALRRIMELCLAGGARLARPGEFTERAFVHGRLDLTQAEAVIDIIRASSEGALRAASGQLSGVLRRQVEQWCQSLVGMLATIEASIDFPDDVEEVDRAELWRELDGLVHEVARVRSTWRQGRILREGMRLAIVGRPNVGKSSLLNRLLREERAIVTDIPGTTRDTVEEQISLAGVPVRLVDTAGLRETADPVERIGVERAYREVERADLVLLVVEAAGGLTPEDSAIAAQIPPEVPVVVVINKTDLAPTLEGKERLAGEVGARAVIAVSAWSGAGLDQLEETIRHLVLGGELPPQESAVVANQRHFTELATAERHLAEAIEALQGQAALDVVSIDLREAWMSLGRITGKEVTDEVINEIFSRFCVGK
ncbi:MAG: tRNA uridine-5-carboxymethylaminomethyl(34) synthesis GTPase MnmE [Bacillota bacterium]